MKKIAFYLIDLLAVLSFVMIGRSAHGHTDSLSGVWRTSWPFLIGATVSWLFVKVRRLSISSPISGVIVVISTVAIGMVIRVLVGQGTALGFIAVSVAYFALTSLLIRLAILFYQNTLRSHFVTR